MTVLYAEDDIDDFDFFCEILKSVSPDSHCLNTRDGAETINFLENATLLPDIIFMDINMPAMDGKACLRNIKSDSHFKFIPVVVYTTSKNKLDQEHCLQLGAVAYEQKPNNVKEAIEKISRLIALGT